MVTEQCETTISLDQLKSIMCALLVGLSAYSEVERVQKDFDALDRLGVARARLKKSMEAENLVPLHPSGMHSLDGFHAAITYTNAAIFRVIEGDASAQAEGSGHA
jgi:hypothetical protein